MIAGLDQVPPEAKGEVISCLENSIGKDKFDRIMAKQDMPDARYGRKNNGVFRKRSGK